MTARRTAKTAMYEQRNEDISEELCSFLADRIPVPVAMKAFKSKNETKEARGKTLNYEKETAEVREGLDGSRKVEWDKWLQFVAGRACRGKELEQLLDEGHEIVPTRWVDVDKHKRRKNGPIIPPEYKSRLTGRGDLENLDGIRTDSPTAEIEAHNLIFSFAASAKVRLKVGDISNAAGRGNGQSIIVATT